MPKPTAIRLSSKTIDKISYELDIPEKNVKDEWYEMVAQNPSPSVYYVKDCLYGGNVMHYMIYSQKSFLNNFASIPPGIEDNFVPVTQVKE